MHMYNIILTDVQAWECANKLGLIGPAMEQPQYNMFEREKVAASPVGPPLPLLAPFGPIWSHVS